MLAGLVGYDARVYEYSTCTPTIHVNKQTQSGGERIKKPEGQNVGWEVSNFKNRYKTEKVFDGADDV